MFILCEEAIPITRPYGKAPVGGARIPYRQHITALNVAIANPELPLSNVKPGAFLPIGSNSTVFSSP
jgi:hypothetical protein